MKKIYIYYLFLFVFSFNNIYAQKTKDVITYHFKYWEQNGSDLKQEKNGLIIEIEPLDMRVSYNHPELYTFQLTDLPSSWGINVGAFYPEYQGKRWCYTFGFGEDLLTVMKVKITNNTGHILKMKDARMLMRVEGEDPIKAVTKVGDPTLVDFVIPNGNGKTVLLPKSAIEKDESLVHWITFFENNWNQKRNKGFLSLNYIVGVPSQVIAVHKKNYKLIGDVDTEILPDDTYSGILLFPRLIGGDPEMIIKFYEFITKVDAGGTPTERTNFEFKFKLAEASEWFNRNENKWEIGTPSSTVEYYDKKQKIWVLGKPE